MQRRYIAAIITGAVVAGAMILAIADPIGWDVWGWVVMLAWLPFGFWVLIEWIN